MDTKTKNNESNILFDDQFIEWCLTSKNTPPPAYNVDREHFTKSRDLFRRSVRLNHHQLSEEEAAGLYESIRSRLNKQKKQRRRLLVYLGMATAGVVLLCLWGLRFFEHRVTPAASTVTGQILSHEDIRIVSGDQTQKIEHNAHICITKSGKSVVSNEESRTETQLDLPHTDRHRLIVPFGKRSTLTLQDGTEIWLNAGTELDFPASFPCETREISVRGEIYIEVARSSKPFIVHAPDCDIHVFGTRFNVSAYPADCCHSVVLAEGKVSISVPKTLTTIELQPNEIFTVEGATITKTAVDADEYTAWKNGYLLLKDQPLTEVLKKIGRYYNVSFDLPDGADWIYRSCSGKLFLADSVDKVMESLTVLYHAAYSRDNQHIFLSKYN
ncbi:MAG: FecR domain-containing protein [Dysgonamonadaceae bacterium]|nr:FecR domain-containing protein [Dysgonamonadaceae bacterium]